MLHDSLEQSSKLQMPPTPAGTNTDDITGSEGPHKGAPQSQTGGERGGESGRAADRGDGLPHGGRLGLLAESLSMSASFQQPDTPVESGAALQGVEGKVGPKAALRCWEIVEKYMRSVSEPQTLNPKLGGAEVMGDCRKEHI